MKEIKKQLKERFGYKQLPLDDGHMPVDYIAAALDPRTKSLEFLTDNDQTLVWKHLSDLLEKMPRNADEPRRDESSRHSLLDQVMSPAIISPLTELSNYRSMPLCSTSEDPLIWWKHEEKRFPTISKLARIYLSFPASSATVERTFSRGSNVMTKKRVRLGDDALEAQIVAAQNEEFFDHVRKRARLNPAVAVNVDD